MTRFILTLEGVEFVIKTIQKSKLGEYGYEVKRYKNS